MEFLRPPLPKTETDPPIVFHDFTYLLGSSSSSVSSPKTPKRDYQETPEISLSLSLSLSGSYNPKRKSTAQIETPTSSSSTISISTAPSNRVRGKRAKTQIDTGLSLAFPVPWTIRKRLEKSDVNNMARLMLPKEAVERHILAHWDEELVRKVKSKNLEGVPVTVYDWDTNVEKTLKLKQWGKGSPVLNDQWIIKFVHRRDLKEGDEIGLFWDGTKFRLNFSVLSRAPPASGPASSSSSQI